MATTCPNCNSTEFTNETYYLNAKTGDKTLPASGMKDSSIIAIFALFLGLGLFLAGVYLLPSLFSNRSSNWGTVLLGLFGGASLAWSGISTLRKNHLLSKLSLITENTCKSCNHIWQEQQTSTKKPVYLTLLPIGAGLFSCMLTSILFDLLLAMLIGIVVSTVVFYITKQKKESTLSGADPGE